MPDIFTLPAVRIERETLPPPTESGQDAPAEVINNQRRSERGSNRRRTSGVPQHNRTQTQTLSHTLHSYTRDFVVVRFFRLHKRGVLTTPFFNTIGGTEANWPINCSLSGRRCQKEAKNNSPVFCTVHLCDRPLRVDRRSGPRRIGKGCSVGVGRATRYFSINSGQETLDNQRTKNFLNKCDQSW